MADDRVKVKSHGHLDYARVLEEFTTEVELEADRQSVLTDLVACFASGTSFLRMRVAIERKHDRVVACETQGAFDHVQLLAQLQERCAANEAQEGVVTSRVAKDAALQYPREIREALSTAPFFARARQEKKLRSEGVAEEAIARFRELYDRIAAEDVAKPPAAEYSVTSASRGTKAKEEAEALPQSARAAAPNAADAFMAPRAPSPPALLPPPPPTLPPARPPSAPPLPYRVIDADAECPGEVAGIELDEGEGNEFHLSVILRKYTAAKMRVTRGVRKTVVSSAQLWDALGLLRSLRYDVDQFNAAAALATEARSERRYLCFRLMRQASAFGVRLPPPGERLVQVAGLDELISHIEGWHAEQLAIARGTVRSGLVDFSSLAELFTPGADLVDQGAATGLYGVPMAVRVRAGYYSRGKSLFGVVSTFWAACEFAVSVGDRFAVIESHQPIPEFQGTRSTTEGIDNWLVLTPPVQELLAKRGQVYSRVATGHSFVEHAPSTFLPIALGRAAAQASGGGSSSSSVSKARSAGRLMVDVSAAWERGVHCARTPGEACEAVMGTLKLVAQRKRATGGATAQVSLEYYGSASGAAASAAAGANGGGAGGAGGAGSAEHEGSLELLLLPSLPPSLLWRTWPVVAGFSFAAKSWGVVLVDGLREARFNDKAFEQLVLPPARKRLIKALVLSHNDHQRETADLIAGKGEGSIFLLHGPPGVGKTLTAEAIAELLHKPLYSVSMGELGTTPDQLEAKLQDILELAQPWGALVLIDEAEMLLERRTKTDILRNAMVCVMLRLLDYYQGVLFLTSNRVASLDPAFQSRVQCALQYDALGPSERAQIWTTLISARGLGHALAGGSAANTIDVAALAAHELNGRQIKNALQLALALARRDSAQLTQAHLLSTLELSMAFADAAGAGDGWEEAGAPARAQRYKEGASALASSHLGLCAARCFGWSCQV